MDPNQTIRKRLRLENLKPSYSGPFHFLVINALILCLLVTLGSHLSQPSLFEYLTIPITFLYANLSEYLGHRGPMHHKTRGLHLVFKRHTLIHHQFYTDNHMASETSQDYKFVLFPITLILFFILGFALPAGLIIMKLMTENIAILFVMTALFYYLNYEWFHLIYHLPKKHPLTKLPGIATLTRHHQIHHDVKRMKQGNFNITYPIFDYIFRTKIN